jgi:hypothetical protein
MHRVLAPGGRLAVAVWGPRDRNPWLGSVFDAVSDVLGMQLPPPGTHGPFALGDAAEVERLLQGAQFTDVAVEEVAVPLRTASFDAWWERTSALAGPLSALLANIDDDTHERLRARLLEAVTPYRAGDGLDFPGVSLFATARRPVRLEA